MTSGPCRALVACIAFAGSLAWVLLTAAPAASTECEPLKPLATELAAAPVVFVGRVTGLEHDRRTATFQVEEVWKGDVEASALVHASMWSFEAIEQAERDGAEVAAGDRRFELGVRYLVLPRGASGDLLLDGICTATRQYASRLDRFRPAGAEVLPVQIPASTESSGDLGWLGIGLLAAGAAVAALSVGVLLRRRGRGPA
jgi:hypothetical protein